MIHVEVDNENGSVLINDEHATLAHTKSRNVAFRIRDALNAPRCLEGQLVEYAREHQPRGVVQSVACLHPSGFQLLVRLDDGALEIWAADYCKVVEQVYTPADAIPPDAW